VIRNAISKFIWNGELFYKYMPNYEFEALERPKKEASQVEIFDRKTQITENVKQQNIEKTQFQNSQDSEELNNIEAFEEQIKLEEDYQNIITQSNVEILQNLKPDQEDVQKKENQRLKESISDEEKFKSVKIFLGNLGILSGNNLEKVIS